MASAIKGYWPAWLASLAGLAVGLAWPGAVATALAVMLSAAAFALCGRLFGIVRQDQVRG